MFFPKEVRKMFKMNTSSLYSRQFVPASVSGTYFLSLTPLHRVFIYKAYVIPLLSSRDALRKKTSKPSIGLMTERMSRELCITKTSQPSISLMTGGMSREVCIKGLSRDFCIRGNVEGVVHY